MYYFFFFKQKTAYEMRISDWSSDVCSSDLADVTRIIDIAKQKGLTPGDYTGSSNANLQDKRSLLKLDWNISDSQRASMTYSRTQDTQPVITNSFSDSLKLSSNYYLNDTDNKSMAFHLYSAWTSNFSTEASFSSAKFHKDRGPINDVAQPAVTVATEVDGPEVVLGTEYRSEEHTSELQSLMRISYAVFCLKKKQTITKNLIYREIL